MACTKPNNRKKVLNSSRGSCIWNDDWHEYWMKRNLGGLYKEVASPGCDTEKVGANDHVDDEFAQIAQSILRHGPSKAREL